MKITLYWHTDDDDVELGTVHLDVLPPPGALVSIDSSEGRFPGHVGRVTEVMIYPATPGSMTYESHERGRSVQLGIYSVFVVPAPGPFH